MTKPKPKPKAAVKRTAAPKSPKSPKPTKVPLAIVRDLAKALERDDAAQQCFALAALLANAATPAAAAAAALVHSRKGAPVARAYLKVLAEGTPGAADEVVGYCATMERGRSAMRGAFVAAWPHATDIAALEAAYRNFARGLIDDPGLLAAGVAAARRLADVAALADRTARFDRATRLAPLIAELAGAAPARARAAKQLATLPRDDRQHVYARVLDGPRRFDESLAIAAVIATADDPAIPDMSLSSAIAELRYHGEKELVAAWQPRVAAGEVALITRLLGLFEWTSLWATDNDHLEPYIHALWPAGGRRDVFEHIEHAMASPNIAVREAVCEEWIREAEGRRAFDDTQIDKLVRSAVAIAEGGDNTDDRRAANRALFYVSHPGARTALFDAIRHASTKHNDELRRNLYFGLSHIDHPDVLPFLIERMFVEREEYWALMEAIADKLDATAHGHVLAALAARAADRDAIHAATVYAEILIDKKPSPRLLVELARAVLAWQPSANDDARRLRYVFEQATVAAFAINSPDAARAFVARANGLPATPYSDYRVIDRDGKTPAAFADSDVKKQLAALAAGKLDRAIAEARKAADAARAAGKPIAATDAQLGALAGCTVASRLLDDRERKAVWFFDEVGELHVYDGYSVMPMVLEVAGVGGRTIGWNGRVELGGATRIDDRATLFDAKHATVREIVQLGARVLVFDGHDQSNDLIDVTLVELTLGSVAAARDVIARFAANPPAGTKRVDSWYLEGAGAVRRAYYTPLPDGGYNSDGVARLVALGKQIEGYTDPDVLPIARDHADAAAAIAALQAWELRVYAAGGRITKIGVDPEATRREDTTLAAYFEERYRTDTESAAWHLRGLADMLAVIDESGLRELVPEITVTLGPPATEAEIAAYQALVPEPLPAPLLELWREVGGGGFTTASTIARLLSPAELIARRAELRDRLRAWAPGHLKGRKLASLLESIDHLDVIATLDGAPMIVFDTLQAYEDGRCFTSADSTWWESALGWQIATDLNVVLKRELERRVGDIYRLRLGQRAGAGTRRARLKHGDKEYEAIVDGAQLMTRTLTVKKPGKPSVKTLASAEAADKAFDAAVAVAHKKGFR